MSNDGATLTSDCWLNMISLFDSFSLVVDRRTGVFDSACSLRVECCGMLNPTIHRTFEGLVWRLKSYHSVLECLERFTGLKF